MTNTPDKSEIAQPIMKAVDSEMRRIKALFEPHTGDAEDLITYARDVAALREAARAPSRPPADQVPDMVERVARAISRATSVDLHGGKLTDYAADDWRDFEGEARAAIAALQAVPTSGEVGEKEGVYRDIFAEITAKARPLCEDESDPEKITGYRLPVGPLHRAAGKTGFQMFNGEAHLARAVRDVDRLKTALKQVKILLISAASRDSHMAPEYERKKAREATDVIDTALKAVPAASGEVGMREALEKCRDRFTEYAREHQRKAQAATHPRDHDERMEKADRNLDMAMVCIAALKAVPQMRDPWNPDPEDPFWMLEIRQGIEDAGAWLKNEETYLTTRDPTKAIRWPSRFAAECARRRLPSEHNGRFEPTEHSWIDRSAALQAVPTSGEVGIERAVKAFKRAAWPVDCDGAVAFAAIPAVGEWEGPPYEYGVTWGLETEPTTAMIEAAASVAHERGCYGVTRSDLSAIIRAALKASGEE